MLRVVFGIVFFAAFLGNFGNGASKSPRTENKEQNTDYSHCGQRPRPIHSRVRRVIGGEIANNHAWPWTVLIMNQTNVHCGGSIISPTYLITAVHCVHNIDHNFLQFFVGKHEVNKTDPYEQQVEVEDIEEHGEYITGNDTHPGDFDVALIKLKKPIKFSEYVRPICLPDVNMFKPGHECMLSGWGVTNETTKKISNILRELRLPLVSQKVCNSNESYQGKIHQRYFCAGFAEGGKDGCAHDSGSPLMCNHGNSDPWYLVGMMIWGEGCARKNKYGVYANISQFLETIKQTVKDLPTPFKPTLSPTTAQTSKKDSNDSNKDKIFIAIIAVLCVIILILVTTLCIVNFYSRGYICCTATEKHPSRHNKAPEVLHEQNGKLNGEVSV